MDPKSLPETPEKVPQIPSESPSNRKFTYLILAIFAIATLVSLGAYVLVNNTKKTSTTSPEVSVSVEKKYDNPFDKKTQYVNPFASYKNPFDSLK